MNNKRFRELLHAYELGIMLSDEEIREVELYLLEHDELLEEAREFHSVIRQLRLNPEVHDSIKRLAQESEPRETSNLWPAILWKRYVPRIISLAGILAIVLLFVLKPWQIDIQLSKEAIAAANSIAVMYFQNLVDGDDPKRLGEITTSLLITDLSESDYVRVLSSQRLYDILKLLGHEGTRKVNIDVASDIARKVDARWILMGDIMQTEPEMVVSAQLIDAKSGLVDISEKVKAKPGEDIFSLTDRLASEIKRNLSLPQVARQEPDPKVADITTHSPEAYRCYLEGIDYKYKMYSDDAELCFKKAIALDPAFAMSHYYVSFYGLLSEQKESIKKAAKHLDHVSKREKYYIKSRLAWLDGDIAMAFDALDSLTRLFPDDKEAYFQQAVYEYFLGRYDESILNTKKAIEIDPLYKIAYNQLAYTYQAKGDSEKAINTIDQYIALVPDEANPYDSQGDIYLRLGMENEAIKSYEKAIEIKPDFNHSLRMLARLYLTRLEFDKADHYFEQLSKTENLTYLVSGKLGHAYSLIYQGRFNAALKELDNSIVEIKGGHEETKLVISAHAHFLKSKIYAELKEYQMALGEIEKYIMEYSEAHSTQAVQNAYFRTYILAAMGDSAAASEFVSAIKDCTDTTTHNYYDYYLAVGSIAYFSGDLTSAAEFYDKATMELNNFQACYLLGKTLLEDGRIDFARKVFESKLNIYSEWATFNGLWDAKVLYYLARVYDASGQTEKAKEYYTNFLKTWKNADPGIEEIPDARFRLKKLAGKINDV